MIPLACTTDVAELAVPAHVFIVFHFFYLFILLTLVYLSKQKVWSKFGAKNQEHEEEAFDKVEKVVTEYEGEDPKTFK